MKAIFLCFYYVVFAAYHVRMSKILFQKNRMLLRIRLLKKVSSLELKQQLLDYLNNSVKTRTTF